MKKGFSLLIFGLLTLLFLSSCKSVSLIDKNLEKKWYIVELKGYTKEDLIKNKASIEFAKDAENKLMEMRAFAGCNQMMYSAEILKGNKLKINGGASTLMACQDMQMESNLSAQLIQMKKYSIEGHYLILSDEKGNKIKLLAEDWD